ncbi:proline--tRNA ligase [Moorella thermoacetica]|uniref:Proline--tRNA ligase n=1 Tax=Moorella thermoacetica (strain ATCC 39073 / JCM 9320) TaxID=264732 RepID=SYP_MOOTA|nr:proline--tRNA ligase [Moorella thermoacetica]Q2RJN1.1 RecName: Full=Proline--tRNA ligase; AltName: Full=Prolyl-tRNA synthetase; Short=ProRS [Moorella thermoacetica ATCC 39073]AKX93805.1 proline--tRNA ligase [Moorella thermoacetica]AKX96447.1 proline--tRNA ligase [Moorella thermoacetica]OIQ57617.1 proline--tRNA ligase [Moorella thermoacetica]QDA00261.1 Proline--tRNA ligase [Moorella thermoacetica]TYL11171.1 Proline--tRNA ligase [Moorella thermoacetica]
MRASELLAPTLRETPAEAEIVSHQLLLRGGFIRKAAAGIYTYLPLGRRVLAKIEQIIREEMDRAGGQEVVLPIIQPAELWQESGRWEVYGEEMFRLQDRHRRQFCLGPTHEEIITALVRSEVTSYKQLPLLLYQIQNKYRDERRPRFGLLRGREFIMKDLYSFDLDQEGLNQSYRKMYQAYSNVFRRCGLDFRPVQADSGAIGGNYSHEFMALATAGEALLVYCRECDYAANVEIAVAKALPMIATENPAPLKEVATPGQKTVAEICTFLEVTPDRLIKTLFYEADGQLIAALVRGDRELNEVKLQNHLGCRHLLLADPERVRKATGAPVGFVGPVGLQGIPLYADLEIPYLVNGVAGANREGYHLVNVNPGRDFNPTAVVDIRQVEAGEPCPQCGAPLAQARGIEVGQVFQLGTKYSGALGANYTDARGQEHPIVMGCYGIGVSRTMAAIVEQCHDDQGIIWPLSVAPYQVVIIPASLKDDGQRQVAEGLYRELAAAGVEVVYDDRDERAGLKFVEADLIGYPLRITVGKRTITSGTVDVKWRSRKEETPLPLEGLSAQIQALLAREMEKYR